MLVNIGHICLVAALFFSLVQAGVLLSCRLAHKQPTPLMRLGLQSQWLTFFSLTLGFIILLYSFVISDFSNVLVSLHSHTLKPMIYKIAGTWANHEGSMLLWSWLGSAYGIILCLTTAKQLDGTTRFKTLGWHGLIIGLFVAYTLFTSTPFIALLPAPLEGLGLNPLLQHPAVAFHPPTLYAGYLGFLIPFCLSMGFLSANKPFDARPAAPFIIFAWSILTLGIGLGSWWAYYELGWGGWWFWDPVENAALIPWLLATALLHSQIVSQNHKGLLRWTLVLSLVTFSMCVLGMFLVRSGVLTSVHAFAHDPERGIFILSILAFLVLSSSFFIVYRWPTFKHPKAVNRITRSGFILLNNAALVAIALIVLLGTLYPLIIQTLMNTTLAVGPPYFEMTTGPIFLTVLILAGLAPFLKWQQPKQLKLKQQIRTPFVLAISIALAYYALQNFTDFLTSVGIGASLWLMASSVKYGWQQRRNYKTWPLIFSHFGVGLAALGMVLSAGLQQELNIQIKQNETVTFQNISYTLQSTKIEPSENYLDFVATFSAQIDGQIIATPTPRLRYFPVEDQTTPEVALFTRGITDHYLVLNEPEQVIPPQANEAVYALRIYHNPGVILIWIGGGLMILGGLLSLFLKRSL